MGKNSKAKDNALLFVQGIADTLEAWGLGALILPVIDTFNGSYNEKDELQSRLDAITSKVGALREQARQYDTEFHMPSDAELAKWTDKVSNYYASAGSPVTKQAVIQAKQNANRNLKKAREDYSKAYDAETERVRQQRAKQDKVLQLADDIYRTGYEEVSNFQNLSSAAKKLNTNEAQDTRGRVTSTQNFANKKGDALINEAEQVLGYKQ